MCQDLRYLTHQERIELVEVLCHHTKLFSMKLGLYPQFYQDGDCILNPHKKVRLDADQNAKPVHLRAFPVPKLHQVTFKKELEHLCNEGVLSPIGPIQLLDLFISSIVKDATFEEKDTDNMCQDLQYLTHQERNDWWRYFAAIPSYSA